MNKYLLVSAAGLFATTAQADPGSLPQPVAAGHDEMSFYITIAGNAYCNEWTVSRLSDIYLNRESLSACTGYTGVTGYGVGMKGKNKNAARYADLPTSLGFTLAGTNLASDLVISLPLRNGGAFLYYYWGANNTLYAIGGNYFLGHPDKSRALKPPIEAAIAKYARESRAPDNK